MLETELVLHPALVGIHRLGADAKVPSNLGTAVSLGDHLEVVMQDGSPMPVMVTEVTETAITLDANHPLAGMDLTFDIRLVEIV